MNCFSSKIQKQLVRLSGSSIRRTGYIIPHMMPGISLYKCSHSYIPHSCHFFFLPLEANKQNKALFPNNAPVQLGN